MNTIKLEMVEKNIRRKNVLSEVNTEISTGEIVGVLGLNGVGKTTLLKMMAGQLKPSSGIITYDGNPISTVSDMNDIIYIPDENILPKYYTAEEIMAILNDRNPNYNKDYAIMMLNSFGINRKQRIGSLSKGNQEIVQLAVLVANESKFIIMDEPLAAVDISKREVILDMFIDMQVDDRTIILSSHLISDIESILSRVLLIEGGTISQDIKLQDTLDNEVVNVYSLLQKK